MPPNTLSGEINPLGATVREDGVNFSVFSKNCERIELLLFDDADDKQPSAIIPLDPDRNRTFYYWHVLVPKLTAGQLYGYRVYGPHAPDFGHRFDGSKVLLDPYTKAVAVGKKFDRIAACRPGDNCAYAMKSVVVDTSQYNWQGDTPLQRTKTPTIIYEMHVGGFTRNPNSGLPAAKRGTFAGVIEKIPYLSTLGITAVELLPVCQYDEQDAPAGHSNYWGYSPVAFFAPHNSYCSCSEPHESVNEFRDMVKAFHRAGIEVILDVVFNHTAEGNHTGPTYSFRGFENRGYYTLDQNRALYANYSGCGNTLNANQSIVRRMIMDCLHYWVTEMHVDGFRFDLASALARDEAGQPLVSPPILWEIESDPVLAGTKIIAEAWDAGGLYQVGTFIGHRWAEWNGQYRDDIRHFVKSDEDTVAKLALRMVGSPDIYPQEGRQPSRSVNFMTCHDGFTLNDLVSYNDKHNEANGEQNRDGLDGNISWNCGVEGATDNVEIEALRLQQIKNFFTILLLSQGTPMMLMGDEVRRTQQGNNNAYCQNNELSWFNWDDVEPNAGLFRFVQGVITFIKSHPIFSEDRFWTTPDKRKEPRLTWHGVKLDQLDWRKNSHSVAFTLHHWASGEQIHVMLNAYWEPLNFELPHLASPLNWHRIIDTALATPNDVCSDSDAPPLTVDSYNVSPRSCVVLLSR